MTCSVNFNFICLQFHKNNYIIKIKHLNINDWRGVIMSFLDDLFSKAKDVSKAAGKKTDNLVKISKLKMQCATINNNIKSTYEKLGNIVYDMIKSDSENQTVLLGVVQEIDDLYKQLERTTKKLEKLRKIYSCPRCDEKNKATAVYCAKCGKKLVVTDSYEENEVYADVDIDEDDDDDIGFPSVE